MKKHTSVLKNEVLKILDARPGGNFIDCTLGFAGHAKEILEMTAPDGQLLGIEQDEVTLRQAEIELEPFAGRFRIEHANFTQLGLLIRRWDVDRVDGVLIDLGPSTPQLTGGKGFSFQTDSYLDMRMNPQAQRQTAADILNKFSEHELEMVLRMGEERFAKPIAKRIVEERRQDPIEKTFQLVEIIKTATPPSYRFSRKTHFATATFRALRMAVNQELENLEKVLPQAAQVVSPNGRIAVISFHSLEDRIVKNFLRDRSDMEVLTPKPIVASEDEIRENPSARSAKLRGAKKL
jgi:16S rRNA (cytosine1402-N4)-methyltransferase